MWEDAQSWAGTAFAWLWNKVERFDINQAIANLFGDALGAFLFLVLGAVFVFLGGRKLAEWLREQAKARVMAARIKGGLEEHYTVLVAKLDGDSDGRQQRHIIQSLDRQFGTDRSGSGVSVRAYPEMLAVAGSGDRAAARANAEDKGRRWLTDKKADILVWGEVGKADEVLRLRVLVVASESASEATGYVLTDTLELPIGFGNDLGAVLEGVVAANIAPAYDGGSHYIADVLESALPKLRALASSPPAAMPSGGRASLLQSYAVTAYRLGEQRGDSARLDEAVAAYREALKEWTRERVPLGWAATQNNIGNVLNTLGERESGTARLDEAVAAYREALEERTRERVPLDWAMTQNNIGNALTALGKRESGTARLDEAVAAYREALKEWTREQVPLHWAATQNNIGNALWRLGEREKGTARLDEAVAAYREALKERTRERAPLDWAMTQNNIGNALTALGKRESGTARLDEAVAAYREALKEWTRERVPLHWAATQSNLSNTLWRLGERANEPDRAAALNAKVIAICETVSDAAQADETRDQGKPGARSAKALASLAWYYLLAQQPKKALVASQRAVALMPEIDWIKTNLAHGLMFTNSLPEAKAAYLAGKGSPLPENGGELWENVIADDFTAFREAGLSHPLMSEIENALGVSGD